MKYFKNLKTSEKISLSFSLFSFLMLVLLLITINIIYFFIWYNDQKEMSFSDMEKNYLLSTSDTLHNIESFEDFLMTKNTLIIPDTGKLICSPGVAEKVHGDIEQLRNKLFYSIDGTTYFIYSRYFDGVGEVKVFFDTTSYVYSQILIIRISLVIIFISFFLTFLIGRIISTKLLAQLKNISQQLQDIDIETQLPEIVYHGSPEDEISILAQTLSKSFHKIEIQTQGLKQFLTDVSHEFKTPLMSINSKIELYQKKYGETPEQLDQVFSSIKNQTQSMNILLESLFFLSRVEGGNICLVRENFNVSQYLPTFFEEFSKNFIGKNIQIHYDLQDDVYIHAEKNTFDIILKNIFSNAYKFSREGGDIYIGCNIKSFWIQDSGIGMSSQDLEHIGEKFYKGERNTSGFGVGLFLVKRILKIYEWRIEFFSEIGKGTKVQMYFH